MQLLRQSLKLKRSFYQQDTITVAQDLLGKILVHRFSKTITLAGRICETEAYLGIEDPAAHSFGKRQTNRTATMYQPGGTAYVFHIYGMYYCFNVVTQFDEPEAVLIRALEPLEGLNQMRINRKKTDLIHLCSGPGKLCQALQIARPQNGLDLCESDQLFIIEDPFDFEFETGVRIGVDYAGDAALWPLRFGIKGSPHLSKKFELGP